MWVRINMDSEKPTTKKNYIPGLLTGWGKCPDYLIEDQYVKMNSRRFLYMPGRQEKSPRK